MGGSSLFIMCKTTSSVWCVFTIALQMRKVFFGLCDVLNLVPRAWLSACYAAPYVQVVLKGCAML